MQVTLTEARAFSRPAYRDLAGGAVLRFDPHDDGVRELAYPAPPGAWKQAQYTQGAVPEEGWRHLAGCGCPACVAGDGGDRLSPAAEQAR
jgi:hypothetical protein